MKTIVFVDDEENILSGFKRTFRDMSEQWQMHFFNDPNDALGFAQKNNVDVVITDYRMPKINGLELLKKIKSISGSTKGVILSGQSDESVYEEVKQISDAYLGKPVKKEEILQLVDKW